MYIVVTVDEIVDVSTAALFANTASTIVLIPGDPILALLQAAAAGNLQVVSNMQALAKFMRAQTAEGTDLDSWMADFAFTRSAGRSASGVISVTAGPGGSAVIGVNQQVSSGTTGVLYKVVEDPDNASGYYNAFTQQYTIPTGMVASIPVESLSVGTSQNVARDSLRQFLPTVVNAISVTNPAPIINGVDRESNPEYVSRFHTHMLSLHAANESAIISAIQTVLGADADYVLLENLRLPNNFTPNFFTVVAENGSGTLTAAQVNDLTDAIDEVRGFGMAFDVVAPVIDYLDCSFTVVFKSGFVNTRGAALAAVNGAVGTLFNKQRIDATLYYSQIIATVMDLRAEYPIIESIEDLVVSGVANGSEEYDPQRTHVVRLGTLSVGVRILPFEGVI